MMPSVYAVLSMPEIVGLLVLALILFGAKKLPELARGLGSGIKEFKKATRDVTDELQSAMDFDRPSSSSRSSQYPAHTEPTSSEYQPGYGGSDTTEPGGFEAGTSEEPPAEPKPQALDSKMNPSQSDPADSAESTETTAPLRAGKSD